MQSTTSLPKGQKWFNNRIAALGYFTDTTKTQSNGICFGVTHMGAQALISRQFDTFNERFFAINDVPLKEFKQTMESLVAKWADICKQIRSEFAEKSKHLTEEEYHRLENIPAIHKKIKQRELLINTLLSEGKIKTEDKDKQMQVAKINILKESLLQEEMERRYQSLEKKEQLLLSCRNFFDGVCLYHHIYEYPELFPEGKSPQWQTAYPAMPFTSSIDLEEKGGMINVGVISGIYSELSTLLNLLEPAINKIQSKNQQHPVAIIASANLHTSLLGYDAVSKKFIFMNSNRLPGNKADKLSSFSEDAFQQHFFGEENNVRRAGAKRKTDSSAFFRFTIYTSPEAEKELRTALQDLQQLPEWKNLHEFNKARLAAIESQNDTKQAFSRYMLWLARTGTPNEMLQFLQLDISADSIYAHKDYARSLLLAALDYENIPMARFLLEHGANPNLPVAETSPLAAAVSTGNIDAINILLNAGAKTDLQDGNTTPLMVAAFSKKHNPEIIATLLAAGADVNAKNNLGATALIHAVIAGNDELIKILMAAGAKTDVVDNDNFDLLSLAAQEGHVNLCRQFLNTSTDIERKLTVNSYVLAKHMDNIGKIEEFTIFLKEKYNNELPDDILDFTPLHLAVFFGHKECVRLLLDAGANPNPAGSVITPQELAKLNNDPDILSMLTTPRAQLYKPGLFRKTPPIPDRTDERNQNKSPDSKLGK